MDHTAWFFLATRRLRDAPGRAKFPGKTERPESYALPFDTMAVVSWGASYQRFGVSSKLLDEWPSETRR